MKLTDAEWFVMEMLWECDGIVLKDAVEFLKRKTHWTRNTVQTYLTRMEKKGLVFIDKEQNPYHYFAAMSKEECSKQEREQLLNKVYQGDVGDLIAAFLHDSEISTEEKERLSQLIDNMEV